MLQARARSLASLVVASEYVNWRLGQFYERCVVVCVLLHAVCGVNGMRVKEALLQMLGSEF